MSALQPLEKNLEDFFVKQAPALPPNGKKALVQYLPWISLILGLISLYNVYALWNWAHLANSLVNYANSINAAYGQPQIATTRFSLGIWLGMIVLLIEALLYLAAFQATRDRKKSGWDLLFYALLINIAYGIVILFTNYGGLVSLISVIIGSAIGLYLLFQIRSTYTVNPAKKKA